jgi:hypothetical protein
MVPNETTNTCQLENMESNHPGKMDFIPHLRDHTLTDNREVDLKSFFVRTTQTTRLFALSRTGPSTGNMFQPCIPGLTAEREPSGRVLIVPSHLKKKMQIFSILSKGKNLHQPSTRRSGHGTELVFPGYPDGTEA